MWLRLGLSRAQLERPRKAIRPMSGVILRAIRHFFLPKPISRRLSADLREVPLAAATHRDGIFPGALKVESSPRTVSPTCARPATHGEEVKKVTERPWGEDVVGAEQAQMVVPISIEILLHHKWLFGETFICFWWFVFPDFQVS